MKNSIIGVTFAAGLATSAVVLLVMQYSHFGSKPATSAPSAAHTANKGENPLPALGDNRVAEIFGDMVTSWREDNFYQSFTVTNFRDVTAVDVTEQPPGTWTTEYYTGSSSFDILMGSANGKDFFYFAGHATNGDVVIEEWRLKAKIAMPGGPPPKKRFMKKEIYRGALPTPVLRVEVDPEKRFLLLLTGDATNKGLYKFDVVASATPELLYDTSTLPSLATMTRMQRFQHLTLGRVWILAAEFTGDELQVILVDSNNDTQFESVLIDTYSGHKAAGVYGSGVWIDTFRGP